MGTNLLVTAIVIVYLLFMLWIGWYSSTKITSNTDFMVAGRRLGPFLMAGTLAATEIGGGSSLGVVQNGMSGFGLSASWYITTMYRVHHFKLCCSEVPCGNRQDCSGVFPQTIWQGVRTDHRCDHAASAGRTDRRTVYCIRSDSFYHVKH